MAAFYQQEKKLAEDAQGQIVEERTECPSIFMSWFEKTMM